MRMKLTMPATVSIMNSTIDGTGLRIDQAEMLRKPMTWLLLSVRPFAAPV